MGVLLVATAAWPFALKDLTPELEDALVNAIIGQECPDVGSPQFNALQCVRQITSILVLDKPDQELRLASAIATTTAQLDANRKKLDNLRVTTAMVGGLLPPPPQTTSTTTVTSTSDTTTSTDSTGGAEIGPLSPPVMIRP